MPHVAECNGLQFPIPFPGFRRGGFEVSARGRRARYVAGVHAEGLAQGISTFSSDNARPNCVIPAPPLASFFATRNTRVLVRIERHRAVIAQVVGISSGFPTTIPLMA